MSRLLTTILFFATSLPALAGVYDLKFRRVSPFSDKARCQSFVEKTAKEFAAQSGATVIEYGCVADDYTIKAWDAVITYQGTALTFTSNFSVSVYSSAFYNNLEACEKELPLQRDLFSKATGLKPLSSYCTFDMSSPASWETRVDGLGEPTLKPEKIGISISGNIVGDKAVIANLQSVAKDYGFTIYEAGIDGKWGTRKLVLRIYATEPISPQDYREMRYDNVSTCVAAAAEASSFLKAAAKPALVFCDKDLSGDRATLHVTTFVPMFKPVSVIRAKALTTEYPSLPACQEAAKKFTPTIDILGALCAGSGRSFHIHLFSRP